MICKKCGFRFASADGFHIDCPAENRGAADDVTTTVYKRLDGIEEKIDTCLDYLESLDAKLSYLCSKLKGVYDADSKR